jgi:hypothetical protein
LLGIVWGLVRGNQAGWSSPEIAGSLTAGAAVLAAFVAWERRAPAPMLPMGFFRNRTFSFTNAASLAMFFGMFASIFLLSQFLQTAQGCRRWPRDCGCCPGRSRRCSSPRSPAPSPTASADTR